MIAGARGREAPCGGHVLAYDNTGNIINELFERTSTENASGLWMAIRIGPRAAARVNRLVRALII
jgi:hypothetical protein